MRFLWSPQLVLAQLNSCSDSAAKFVEAIYCGGFDRGIESKVKTRGDEREVNKWWL